MKLINLIRHWIHHQLHIGANREEARVPLTRLELATIASDYNLHATNQCHDRPAEVFRHEVFLSPFAPEMRARQLEMETAQFVTEVTEHRLALYIEESVRQDEMRNLLYRRLTAHVVADTTEVKVSYEWDVWAIWKRRLHITRWFPVRTRTAVIDGKVLYPYLKVSMPLNRHHVQFALRP